MVVVSGAARDAASAAADVDARQPAAVHPYVLPKPPVLRPAPSYMFSRRVCDRDALATPACNQVGGELSHEPLHCNVFRPAILAPPAPGSGARVECVVCTPLWTRPSAEIVH